MTQQGPFYPVSNGGTIHVEPAPEHDRPGSPAYREISSGRILRFHGADAFSLDGRSLVVRLPTSD